MIKLSVPSRFELDMLAPLATLNGEHGRIGEIYGSLPRSIIGHGRPAGRILQWDSAKALEQVGEFTRQAHDLGFEVNYLLNSTCLGNVEFTSEGRKAIERYLGQIYETGVDTVTVALPNLLELIQRQFPSLKVKVSILSRVDSPRQVQMFEGLGADAVVLDWRCNRDFSTLDRICRATRMELELVVNDGCLFQCPYELYHSALMAHSSKEGPAAADCIDYCLLKCDLHRMADLAELLRSPWIRPEDLPFYEERFRISRFKISGRQHPTEWILRTARAYSELRYDGNLLDLLNVSFINWALHPATRAIVQERRPDRFLPPDVYLDNQALNDFVGAIVRRGGGNADCGTCRLCERYLPKVVRVGDPSRLALRAEAVSGLVDDLLAGRWTV